MGDIPLADRNKCENPNEEELYCLVFPKLFYVIKKLGAISNSDAAKIDITRMNNGIV